MANLIKVEQVKTTPERGAPYYDARKTGLNIMCQVLGGAFKLDFKTYKGVDFLFMKEEAWSYRDTKLAGIQMSVGDYGRKTIRRVMINKDGMIDADIIKTKFAELKKEADDLAKRRKESADYQKRAEALRDRIAKAVNHPDKYDFDTETKVELDDYSPEEVKMEAKVNGTQLTAIEKLMGKQSVEIELKVPEDKAVEVYNILKGE